LEVNQVKNPLPLGLGVSDRIKYDISSALKFNKDNAEALVELLDYIDSELYDVVDEIEQAKESGISMEARLEKYKDAIEDLGFQRVNE